MSEVDNKYLSEAQMKEQPTRRLNLVIADGAVGTSKLANGAVTADKLSYNLKEEVTKDLQNQIASIQASGIAISNRFGDREDIGVSQKTLTNAIMAIWDYIDPEGIYKNFKWSVTPSFIYGNTEKTISIEAECIEKSNPFEYIAFYLNNEREPFASSENVSVFNANVTISSVATIRCEAVISGFMYTETKAINSSPSIFYGSTLVEDNLKINGITYNTTQALRDIINTNHTLPLSENLIGNVDVTVSNDGYRIVIVMDASIVNSIRRIDMNGVEMKFSKTKLSFRGTFYSVWVSDPLLAGTYNLDINC